MNSRNPSKSFRKSTEPACAARTGSLHALRVPNPQARESVFSYANVTKGHPPSIDMLGGEIPGRGHHFWFKLKKNFTSRAFEDKAESRFKPSVSTNSTYRNAGTYFTSPNGRSAVVEAYRRQLPTSNIDENSMLGRTQGIESSTLLASEPLGHEGKSLSKGNLKLSGKLAVPASRTIRARPMTAGQRISISHTRYQNNLHVSSSQVMSKTLTKGVGSQASSGGRQKSIDNMNSSNPKIVTGKGKISITRKSDDRSSTIRVKVKKTRQLRPRTAKMDKSDLGLTQIRANQRISRQFINETESGINLRIKTGGGQGDRKRGSTDRVEFVEEPQKKPVKGNRSSSKTNA